MSEIPKGNPQFVGQANATHERSPSEEFVLTSEQQQIVDIMKKSGEMSRQQLGKAVEKAGKQLQQLHGKELVKAGLKKIGLGLGLGWTIQTGGALIGEKIGRNVGVRAGEAGDVYVKALNERFDQINPQAEDVRLMHLAADVLESARDHNLPADNFAALGREVGAQVGSDIGKPIGLELTGMLYGLLTRKSELPKLRWYDWALGQFGMFIPGHTSLHIKRFDLNLVNPVTVSGLFNVAKGLFEMGIKPKEKVV